MKRKNMRTAAEEALDGDRGAGRAVVGGAVKTGRPAKPVGEKFQPVQAYLGPKLLAAIDDRRRDLMGAAVKANDARAMKELGDRSGVLRAILREALGVDREAFE